MEIGSSYQDLPGEKGQGKQEPALVLDLDGVEILFLWSIISVGDISIGDTENPTKVEPLGRNLILKLVVLFLNVIGPVSDKIDRDYKDSIWLTEKEMWLIRAKIGLADEYMNRKVGVSLHRKLAHMIITFSSGVQYLQDSDSGDFTYKQAKQRKEQESASE